MDSYLYQQQHLDSSNAADDANLPPGFRFHPTDEELVTYYLLKKVLDSSFSGRAIAEVDLNKCEPWELPEKAKMGEKEWYFFSLRDRKYPTGLRTNRATEAGYWKATGKDREIYSSKTFSLVGMKKTLVFYRGRAPKGEKSNWVMHEYRLEGKFAYHYFSRSSRDEWVISRVFQKSISSSGCSGSTCSGGGKKARSIPAHFFYSEASSASSATLPPLLDSCSPYASLTDVRDGCSYVDSAPTPKEHVSCFSTIASAAAALDGSSFGCGAGFFQLNPQTPSQLGNEAVGVSVSFPSLRSLQDNLQLPNHFLPAIPVVGLGELAGACSSSGYNLYDQGDHKLDGSSTPTVGRNLQIKLYNFWHLLSRTVAVASWRLNPSEALQFYHTSAGAGAGAGAVLCIERNVMRF
ncbi:hypothetical protein SAY86_006128 [Trapa natans]|uniref:NAC domain-containing protein n=1 Tax=Trapa natans TaxID=22666 RepID=A0AAN7LBH4_TRANT|nr:hypothetical protein SAY86_006128 [Trapa natans]